MTPAQRAFRHTPKDILEMHVRTSAAQVTTRNVFGRTDRWAIDTAREVGRAAADELDRRGYAVSIEDAEALAS